MIEVEISSKPKTTKIINEFEVEIFTKLPNSNLFLKAQKYFSNFRLMGSPLIKNLNRKNYFYIVLTYLALMR